MVMFQLQDGELRNQAGRWQEARHRGEVFNISGKKPLVVGRKHLGPRAHGDIHVEIFEILYKRCFEFYMGTLNFDIHWKIL